MDGFVQFGILPCTSCAMSGPQAILWIKSAAFRSQMLTQIFVQVGRTEELHSLLPVEVAASVLENFYNAVIDCVRQNWIQQQPVNSFTITWQNIELEFYSATRKIPVRQHLKWFLPVQCPD